MNISSEKSRLTGDELSSNTVDVCGVLLYKKAFQARYSSSKREKINLVLTKSTRHNLHSLALALSLGDHIYLEGPSGSGKTRLIEYLHSKVGHSGNTYLLLSPFVFILFLFIIIYYLLLFIIYYLLFIIYYLFLLFIIYYLFIIYLFIIYYLLFIIYYLLFYYFITYYLFFII